MKKVGILIILFFCSISGTQAQLLPTIGLTNIPSDNSQVCTLPWYLGSFYASGLQEGNYAHDFKLYDVNGDSLVLSQKLATGKPVLLIAGSLTCPVFMGKIPLINQVISTYANQLQVYVIYVVEAHPTDTSVYFGYVNVTTQNMNAGILFPQPITYGERKHLMDTMSYWATLNAPVFIDGPCNDWWTSFGPAPNNAYLIDTNGKIVAKHGWFHKNQDHIFCDVDSLLGINSGLCTPAAVNGTFQLQVLNNTASGNAGALLYDYANLINNSNADVTIAIKKLQKNLPPAWQTAFCADVCYSPSDDSITVTVPANDTMLFSLDFITGAIPDSGNVNVGFKNINNNNNSFQSVLRAFTLPLISQNIESGDMPVLFPNPAGDYIELKNDGILHDIKILNFTGLKINCEIQGNRIHTGPLVPGTYLMKYKVDHKQYITRFVKE